jgi:hypothetical protein
LKRAVVKIVQGFVDGKRGTATTRAATAPDWLTIELGFMVSMTQRRDTFPAWRYNRV